jgi:hypothetical protein
MVTDMLWLRAFYLLANLLGLIRSAYFEQQRFWTGIWWALFFISANIYQIIRILTDSKVSETCFLVLRPTLFEIATAHVLLCIVLGIVSLPLLITGRSADRRCQSAVRQQFQWRVHSFRVSKAAGFGQFCGGRGRRCGVR